MFYRIVFGLALGAVSLVCYQLFGLEHSTITGAVMRGRLFGYTDVANMFIHVHHGLVLPLGERALTCKTAIARAVFFILYNHPTYCFTDTSK